jgi:retron-type reverse transcriptase
VRLDQPTGADEDGDPQTRTRARDVVRNDGVSNLQALQRVLYRSAKQDPTRRFHALYDKLTRSDVMWQAWVNVATNHGAPGIDGVSIDSVEAGGTEGVRSFLDSLAAEVKAQSYRPQPLRRVNIPKAGKPGETRPLGIPTLRDRVLMSAAKLVLEPISRPTSARPASVSDRSGQLMTRSRSSARVRTGERIGCSTPTSKVVSTRSTRTHSWP